MEIEKYGAKIKKQSFSGCSVRLEVGKNRDIGLATTTYSFNLSIYERQEAARRIAVMWNIFKGIPTEDLITLHLLTTQKDVERFKEECLNPKRGMQ